jgi:hypothetical protein
VIGLGQKANAQKLNIPDPELDSAYVEVDYKQWSIRAFGVIKYHTVILKNNKGGVVKYFPTDPLSIGLGFAYRFLLIDIGIRLNKDNTLSRLDLHGNLVLKKNLIEVFIQRYEGFQERADNSINLFRDDLKSSLFAINHFYNFNNKKLSLGSVLAGNKIQKKSTGTFVLGSYFSYNQVKADSSIVNSSEQNSFNEFANFTNLKTINFGAYFGYAYSLVLPKNFAFFSTINPGLGFNISKSEGDETYTPPIFPSGKLNFRASLGHYAKRIYIILGFNTYLTFIKLGHGNRYTLNAGQLKLAIGYRMNSKNKITETIDKTF